MASEKQLHANRKNAILSTGPKTEAGKQQASKNSMKHGLLATETLLPWENSSELALLKDRLLATLQPEGNLELLLVDRIISLTWRLRRAGRIETGIIAWKRYQLNYELIEESDLKRDNSEMDDTRHSSAVTAIQNTTDLPELGLLFIENSEALFTLSKYESGIERSLFRTLNELRGMQYLRNQTQSQGESRT